MVNATESIGLPGCTEPGAPAGRDTSHPGGAAALFERLAAVEAGIRDDRHRQPAAVVETVATLWAAGETLSGISARTGISREIVRDRLRRAGVLGPPCRNPRRHVREVLEQQGARLIAAYEAGASVHALAAGAGISDSTLGKYLAVEGVALRRSRVQAREVLEARGAELIAAYESGRSLHTVAAESGVGRALLQKYLVDHDIAIRTRRKWAWERLEPRAPELIAAYESGATFESLAAGAGVSETTMGRFLAACGVVIRGRHRRTLDRLEPRGPELVAAYQDGAALSALAAEAGVAPTTISAFLVAQGVRLRHDHGWYRRRRRADG